MGRKLIIDCDPGHDDAVAIMMAGNNPAFDLLGITTVRGNQSLEKTTRNALNVCQYLGIDVPVCKGCAVPIVRDEPPLQQNIHGESGLDGPVFDELKKEIDSRSAIEFIIGQVRKYPGEVTIAITGPMTNAALALKVAPDIIPLIKQIVFMGGSWTNGNVTPAAEFNIWADAEAAKIVVKSGIPIVMMGLDITRKVLCCAEIIERMEKIKNPASRLFADLMRFFCKSQKAVYGWEGGPLHDPTTIAYLIDPSVITTKDMYTEIETEGASYGRTNCNPFLVDGAGNHVYEPNMKVSVEINAGRFWDIVEECIRNYDQIDPPCCRKSS